MSTYSAEGPVTTAGPSPFAQPSRWYRTRSDARWGEYFDRREQGHWQDCWSRACELVGLSQMVQVAGGLTISVPRVEHMSSNPPYLIVKVIPGQVVGDFVAAGPRLAAALGVSRLRFSARGKSWIRVDMLLTDPLAEVIPMPEVQAGPLLIGVDEDGRLIERQPISLPHTAVQGATGSGKSIWTYGLLSQLVRHPDVLVAGCDPSGLLFRPFSGSRHADWQASGVADPETFAKVLTRLVNEMDQRILELPDDADQVVTWTGLPLIVVVLEEIAALYRVCEQQSKELVKLVRLLISRLLAEGRKAGIHVVMIVQRAEATLIGGFERAQCAMRISFGTDSLESVRLLHPAASAAVAEEHFAAPPGVALLSAPGLPLLRFRSPLLGDYADYTTAVRSACRAGPTP